VAVAIPLGLYGLRRPGELTALRAKHVLHCATKTVVTITSPKTRRAFGRYQFSLVDHPLTARWLAWLLEGVHPELKVFLFGTGALTRHLRQLLSYLGAPTGFSAGSLRPGGATALLLNGMAVDQLRFRGRWRSEKTLEHYVQEAMSVRILGQLDAETTARIQALLALHPGGVAPPSLPWTAFFNRDRQTAAQARALALRR
jgi:hypothetical protein